MRPSDESERPDALVAARLDRLPASAPVWRIVILISLGGFFEIYELFSTAYVAPGLVRSGILRSTTAALFDLHGLASYIAATFVGLFVGSFAFGFAADRCGRRAVFTWSLIWYSAFAVLTALQREAVGLDICRLLTGLGLGVELVTIDAYLSELVPPRVRGAAFAVNQVISYSAVPAAALAAWRLVPLDPFGLAGWRWVMLMGAAGALFVWLIRLGLPESPRWLASHGRIEAAMAVLAALEAEAGPATAAAAPAGPVCAPPPPPAGRISELWGPTYRRRTVMLLVFHVAQAIGLFGFANWIPTFLIQEGVTLTRSLLYTLVIAFSTPLGALAGLAFADRFERRWQIVAAAGLVAASGLEFAQARSAGMIMTAGSLVALGAAVISFNFHAYQAELYPTRIRALAVGVVYSASRFAGVFSGFLISTVLSHGGVPAALALIAGCMAVVMVSIGWLGPATAGRSLEELTVDLDGRP